MSKLVPAGSNQQQQISKKKKKGVATRLATFRLGKSACPCDQKKAVDDQKMIPGRPHDDQNIFFDNLNF